MVCNGSNEGGSSVDNFGVIYHYRVERKCIYHFEVVLKEILILGSFCSFFFFFEKLITAMKMAVSCGTKLTEVKLPFKMAVSL